MTVLVDADTSAQYELVTNELQWKTSKEDFEEYGNVDHISEDIDAVLVHEDLFNPNKPERLPYGLVIITQESNESFIVKGGEGFGNIIDTHKTFANVGTFTEAIKEAQIAIQTYLYETKSVFRINDLIELAHLAALMDNGKTDAEIAETLDMREEFIENKKEDLNEYIERATWATENMHPDSSTEASYAVCDDCRSIIKESDLVGGIKQVEPPNECPDCGAAVRGPYTMQD